MNEILVWQHGEAIRQAAIYIAVGVVIAGVVVAIALFRLARAVRDRGAAAHMA